MPRSNSLLHASSSPIWFSSHCSTLKDMNSRRCSVINKRITGYEWPRMSVRGKYLYAHVPSWGVMLVKGHWVKFAVPEEQEESHAFFHLSSSQLIFSTIF